MAGPCCQPTIWAAAGFRSTILSLRSRTSTPSFMPSMTALRAIGEMSNN